ncbi:MmcQ/YjbR family DNA-binding protein [Stackebrandtia soli]|uniref:MmcQ/YjbR family DNA-binding protein n=1 Tax=Stackebrandtia soli TaxID=1892856 RepID=UPI0039EBAD26
MSVALARLRSLCSALPEAVEGVTVHHPSFNVRGKTFALCTDSPEPDLWIKSTLGDQAELIATDATRYFKPPYLGPRGWVGVRVDGADWSEVAELVTDAYRLAAPKRLIRQLDDPS